MFTVAEAIVPKGHKLTKRQIAPGAGYSRDLQEVATQQCYNAAASSPLQPRATIQLNQAKSSLDLAQVLRISIGNSRKSGRFAAGAAADYVRSLEDNDHAISLNYYTYAASTIAVDIAGFGKDALTEFGKTVYQDGTNPNFALVCGDNYISSYEKGALLTIGLNIKLSSASARLELNRRAEFSSGDIVNVLQKLKTLAAQYNIAGSVTVKAFQIGGEPSQLSKILNRDDTGNYHDLSCNLQAMDSCIRSASNLLDYAVNKFPNQFSFGDNTGLTPLGVGFIRYSPMERLGLRRSVS